MDCRKTGVIASVGVYRPFERAGEFKRENMTTKAADDDITFHERKAGIDNIDVVKFDI